MGYTSECIFTACSHNKHHACMCVACTVTARRRFSLERKQSPHTILNTLYSMLTRSRCQVEVYVISDSQISMACSLRVEALDQDLEKAMLCSRDKPHHSSSRPNNPVSPMIYADIQKYTYTCAHAPPEA